MKTIRMALIGCMALVFAIGSRGQDHLTPGNMVVAGLSSEACGIGGKDISVGLDSINGPFNLVTISQYGLCKLSDRRFSPEGDRLPALNAGSLQAPIDHGPNLSIAPSESTTVIFDES